MKPLKPLKKNISLSLDPDVIDKIRALADNEDRSLSQCINIILRQWVCKYQKSNAPDQTGKL